MKLLWLESSTPRIEICITEPSPIWEKLLKWKACRCFRWVVFIESIQTWCKYLLESGSSNTESMPKNLGGSSTIPDCYRSRATFIWYRVCLHFSALIRYITLRFGEWKSLRSGSGMKITLESPGGRSIVVQLHSWVSQRSEHLPPPIAIWFSLTPAL